MGQIKKPLPVLLFIAAFSRDERALALGRAAAEEHFGPIRSESAPYFVDDYTGYYQSQMGSALVKRFWSFEHLIDPGELADIKRETNLWEDRAAERLRAEFPSELFPERPLNLDPGYIDLGKFVLASTKDHGHRIYLRDGIFAEITLSYSQKRWQALPWTYADYKNEANQVFLTDCRNYLHQRRQGR